MTPIPAAWPFQGVTLCSTLSSQQRADDEAASPSMMVALPELP